MSEQSDFELLRSFVRQGEQAAFATVVRRHLNLVYATAVRKVQDNGAAQEVAQNVFSALARKAWQFAADDSLPAWLYKTTLLESRHWLRGEMRRRRREQTAAELGTTMKTPDDQPALRALVPLLDEALLSLRERDRDALLLRFYENQSLRELGVSLGIGEDAAQKRVVGALGKLTAFFQRRGFRTTSVAASAAALQHTATPAPAGIANAVVVAAGQISPPTLLGLAAVAGRLGSWTKLQTAVVCVAVAIVPLAWQWSQQQRARAEVLRVQSEAAGLETELSMMRSQIDRFTQRTVALEGSIASANESANKSGKTEAELDAWKERLRKMLAADNYRWPDDSPLVRIPKKVVKELNVWRPIAPPGVVRPEERELLGLTPVERQRLEAGLQSHFAAVDQLIETQIYETNQMPHFGNSWFSVPGNATASRIWAVPALGDEVKARGNELGSLVEEPLGADRWKLVSDGWSTVGSGTLRQILNLDAGTNAQEFAIWTSQSEGKSFVGFGRAGNNAASSQGIPWDLFKPGATDARWGTPAKYLADLGLPGPLQQRMLEWIEQQALPKLEDQP